VYSPPTTVTIRPPEPIPIEERKVVAPAKAS
jgi:hypothetical protein